jgi:hypothetical protein
MIRPSKAVSSPNFYPGCESEEWTLKTLKYRQKMSFQIV